MSIIRASQDAYRNNAGYSARQSWMEGRGSNATIARNSGMWRTNRPTYLPTDRARCRVTCQRLKRNCDLLGHRKEPKGKKPMRQSGNAGSIEKKAYALVGHRVLSQLFVATWKSVKRKFSVQQTQKGKKTTEKAQKSHLQFRFSVSEREWKYRTRFVIPFIITITID